MSLLSIILPIVVLVAAGYALSRFTTIETHSLSRVTLYLLTPSLVFTTLVRTDLAAGEGARLTALILAHMAVLLGLALAAGRLLRLPPVERSALGLVTVLYNAGNYGLPASLFAFGEAGFHLATVIFVLSAMVAHSGGVFLASAGRNAPARAALDVFRLPLIYAAVLGLLFARMGWTVPSALWRPLELMGQGAIPLLLLTLGVQLAQARPAALSIPLGAAAALRLVVSPVLVALMAPWFGIGGLARDVAVLSTAMPAAVNAFLIASQFDTAPEFVAGAVFVTTVASFATVPIVLALLS